MEKLDMEEAEKNKIKETISKIGIFLFWSAIVWLFIWDWKIGLGVLFSSIGYGMSQITNKHQ